MKLLPEKASSFSTILTVIIFCIAITVSLWNLDTTFSISAVTQTLKITTTKDHRTRWHLKNVQVFQGFNKESITFTGSMDIQPEVTIILERQSHGPLRISCTTINPNAPLAILYDEDDELIQRITDRFVIIIDNIAQRTKTGESVALQMTGIIEIGSTLDYDAGEQSSQLRKGRIALLGHSLFNNSRYDAGTVELDLGDRVTVNDLNPASGLVMVSESPDMEIVFRTRAKKVTVSRYLSQGYEVTTSIYTRIMSDRILQGLWVTVLFMLGIVKHLKNRQKGNENAKILIVILSCLITLSPSNVHATVIDVFVKVGDKSGRGIAITRGIECFVLTVNHLVGDPFPIVVIGVDRRESSAQVVYSDSDTDIAILKVPLKNAVCGNDYLIDLSKMDQLLKESKNGTLRSRNEDGTEFSISVELRDTDNNFIKIKPIASKDHLQESYSGSILYVDEHPIGLLQSILVTKGEGIVYRFDRIEKNIGNILPLALKKEKDAPSIIDPDYNIKTEQILLKRLNYVQSAEFCSALFTRLTEVSGGAKKFDLKNMKRERNSLGNDIYVFPSAFIPGLESLFEFDDKMKQISFRTNFGRVPKTPTFDDIWEKYQKALDTCLKNRDLGKTYNFSMRSGPDRRQYGYKVSWDMNYWSPGFLGMQVNAVPTINLRTDGVSDGLEFEIYYIFH